MNEKIEALAKFLEVEVDEVEQTTYDDDTFKCGNAEYMVLDDEEADRKTEEEIRRSLWAFNTDFILNHSKIEWSEQVERAFKKMQEELCESANEIVFAVLEDFDNFVQEAVGYDGRGHFLSQYDSEENEVEFDDETYYIYRTN